VSTASKKRNGGAGMGEQWPLFLFLAGLVAAWNLILLES
jgi:hypothetical protein